MKVHEVIHNAALQVVFYLVDDDLLADIYELYIRQVFLVLIDCLVDFFIVPDPIAKVLSGNFGILPFVVGRGSLDFQDIAHDQVFIVALRLYIQGLDIVGFATLVNPSTAGLGRVGGVQDCHDSFALFEPFHHVHHGGFSSGMTKTLPFRIRGIKEMCSRLWSIRTAIGAYVEILGRYRKPGEVADH